MHQRQELSDLLESSTLRSHGQAMLPTAYERAVKQAALETGIDESPFPGASAWSLDEIVPEDDATG